MKNYDLSSDEQLIDLLRSANPEKSSAEVALADGQTYLATATPVIAEGQRVADRLLARWANLPAPPLVHSVIPLFRWEDGTEHDQPMARRRTRRSGVRVYLERPWFTTGADEQIGVVLAVGARPDTTFTSQ